MYKELEDKFRRCIKECFRRKKEVLKEMGLFRGQTPIIYILWEQDGRTQKELATRMEVNAPTISKMINRMEKSGFIEKRRDEKDKRITRIYLTEKAREMKGRLDKAIEGVSMEMFEGFSEEDSQVFGRYLDRIRENVGGQDG